MRFTHWLSVIALALALLAGGRAEAEPRIALVIGNGQYSGTLLQPLKNPTGDAKLMAATLKKAGFKVLVVENAGLREMKIAIGDFGAALAEAGPSATGLFFFAGYGVQGDGASYLLPIGAKLRRTIDLGAEAVALDMVMKEMHFAGSAVNIAIIDAGRSNPLAPSYRGATLGLAETRYADPNVFVSYSTVPGTTALDGKGSNSPYVSALASAMLTPGVDIHRVFETVRRDVFRATDEGQVTWDASTLMQPFFFLPPPS
jgi:carboxyl-terminal processing protease